MAKLKLYDCNINFPFILKVALILDLCTNIWYYGISTPTQTPTKTPP
jgi:hypothetical protein